MPTTRLATKKRHSDDRYYIKAEITARTLNRLKRIMFELNWDHTQVLECAVDMLFMGTTRKTINAHTFKPKPAKKTTK